MVFGKPQRCEECDKIVGFAEAVHSDTKVFHRDCYRCKSCNKKLQRGQGLTHNQKNYCHNCHAKLFAPGGFRPGVRKAQATISRVKMKMQPPFAHVSVNIKESPIKQVVSMVQNPLGGSKKKKEHVLDVAMYTGKSLAELETYLKEGNVDISKWDANAMKDLLAQLTDGQSELGLDQDGNALRVASVVKTIVYDAVNDVMLFCPLSSNEQTRSNLLAGVVEEKKVDSALGALNDNAYKSVIAMCDFHMDHVPETIHDFVYPGVYENLGFNNVASSGFEAHAVAQGKVEIPAALVLETTFPTLKETPADAGARLFTGKFSMKHATPRIFSRTVHKTVKTHNSARFPGLRSEYHIHYITLKTNLITPLQKSLNRGSVTPIELKTPTASGMNTNWFVWLHRGHGSEEALLKELETLYKSNKRVAKLVGDVDFKGEIAKQMAGVMLDEMKALDNFFK